MKIYKIAQNSLMYHVTKKDRLDSIKKNGLLVNQSWQFSEGSRDFVEKIYGLRPIFLSFDANNYQAENSVVLAIETSDLYIVADIPSLYDRGGYYSMNSKSMYWMEGTEPPEIKDYLGQDGELFFDDLLKPRSKICQACIKLTRSAACMENIPLNKIRFLI